MCRPKVVIHSVASVDGRLTMAPDVLLLYGDERWQAVAGMESQVGTWLKQTHRPQATLEGSGSLMLEGTQPEPLPPVEDPQEHLYQDFLPEIVIRRPGHQGWFVVVDGRGRVRWTVKDGSDFGSEEWRGWYLLVLVNRQTPPAYLAYLQQEDIPYLVAGDAQVDLGQALEKLYANLDITCLLSTAGGRLNGALLRAGLVDEIDVEFFPAVIGGRETPSLFDGPALQAGEWPTHLKLLSAQVQAEGRIWLRYQVVDRA